MDVLENKAWASKLCEETVSLDIVAEAKHSDADSGVCCFYANIDDMRRHRKILTYFIENNMIRQTKSGKYYDISFKKDEQTDQGEYGEGFSRIEII